MNEPASSEHVLYVFYDFETTQYTKRSDKASVNISNLVCLHKFCSKCENTADIEQDYVHCRKIKNSFWDNPVDDMLSYLFQSRQWAKKIIVIAHNAKAFDLHFILNRAFSPNSKLNLIINGMKIMSMRVEHLVFLDNISFLSFALRKLPEGFGLTASKSLCPHYFNT